MGDNHHNNHHKSVIIKREVIDDDNNHRNSDCERNDRNNGNNGLAAQTVSVIKTEPSTSASSAAAMASVSAAVNGVNGVVKREPMDQPMRSCSRVDEEMPDQLDRMAFEEMCELAVKELLQLFPECDPCHVVDALIRADWSPFTAADILTERLNAQLNGRPNGQPK